MGQKSSGGLDINGIIKQYKVQADTVSAGDFVNFVKYASTTPVDISTANFTGQRLHVELRSDGNILILHNNISSDMLATIVSVSGGDISIVSESTIGLNVGNFGGFAKINETHYFVPYGKDTNCYLYGNIVRVDLDGTVKIGASAQLSYHTYSGLTSEAVALSETSVLVINNYNSSDLYLYATACIIDLANLAITSTSYNNSICTGMVAGQTGRIHKITSTKALVTCSYLVNGSVGSRVMGYIVNVNGTTVSKNTTTIYSTSGDSSYKYAGTTLFESGYGLIGHLAYSTDADTDVMIRTIYINSSSITTYSGVIITSVGDNRKMFYLKEDYGLFMYAPSSGSTLRCRVVRRNSDNTVDVGSECILSSKSYTSNYFDVVPLSDDRILVCHSYSSSYSLRSQVFTVDYDHLTVKTEATSQEVTVKTATSLPFEGVAKTGGSAGTTIDVYTLQGDA